MRLFCWISICYAKSLVSDNLNLVHHFAKSYRIKHRLNRDEYHDLTQEGTLGLIRAAEKYDPERGVRFSTYSSYWIRSYLSKHMRRRAQHKWTPFRDDMIRGSHIDVHPQLNLGVLSNDERYLLYLRYTRGHTFKHIAEQLGVTQHTAIRRHRKIIQKLKYQVE